MKRKEKNLNLIIFGLKEFERTREKYQGCGLLSLLQSLLSPTVARTNKMTCHTKSKQMRKNLRPYNFLIIYI